MEISAGTVTGRTTATNRDGTRAARLLQTMITDAKDIQTVQLVGQAGEESNPPNGSLVLVLAEGESFKLACATADAIIPDLPVGGKRIYSTDVQGENVMAEVRLLPTGAISISNSASSITMAVDGTITFHGTAAIFDCPITAPSVTANGIVLQSHTHSDPQGGNTGGPNA